MILSENDERALKLMPTNLFTFLSKKKNNENFNVIHCKHVNSSIDLCFTFKCVFDKTNEKKNLSKKINK